MADGTDGVLHSQSQEGQTTRASASMGVSLIKGTPAKCVDFTLAPDAETAERQVAEAHEISDTLRSRLVAIRDDL
jgi:hypothetical protein